MTAEDVTNPALVSAVAALVADPMNALKSGELDDALRAATLLVAGDEEGGELVPYLASDADGADLLALFTDWASIHAFVDRECAIAELPAAQAFEFALQHDGAVINPGGPEVVLPLGKDTLNRLLGTRSSP